MASACSHALEVPEVVALISEQVDDNKDLVAAALVNEVWANEATRKLWGGEVSIRNLVRISDLERLQYYASRISFLDILDRETVEWRQLPELCFPRLTRISMKITGPEDEQYLLHFLQPSLRTLYCVGGPFSDNLWMQIETRCPALRQISLTMQPGTLTTHDFLRFLGNMPSLKTVHLDADPGDLELYFHLASRPDLRIIFMTSTILTADTTTKILAKVANPFPELIYLRWRSEGEAFGCLSQHLVSLKALNIHLVDASNDALFAFANCINLATLDVTFETDSHVPAAALLAVARKCSHLHSLDLRSACLAQVDGRSITDDVIRQFATYLPDMTCMKLKIQTDLTVAALIHLGNLCTELSEYTLNGVFNLELLWCPGRNPLFPQVKALELSRVSKKISHERAISILHQQSPQLNLSTTSAKPSAESWNRSIRLGGFV